MLRAAAIVGLLFLVGPADLAWADPPAVDEVVPRSVVVSVGRDHVFATVKANAAPADLGLPSWKSFDSDGDGQLAGIEARRAATAVRDAELEFLCVAVDGTVVPLARMGVKRLAPVDEPVALDARLTIRVEGRAALELGPGEHRFVLYDRPRDEAGIVPIRLNVVRRMTIGEVFGARRERVSDQRLESVVTRFSPATWGTFVKEGATPPPPSAP